MTDADNVQNTLNNAIAGHPKSNPDERRRFLGSLRERVYCEVTVAQLANPAYVTAFAARINDFKPYQVLINGKIDRSLTTPYLQLATKNDLKFTLINDETAQENPEAPGILVVSDVAINEAEIELKPAQPAEQQPEKKSFLNRLFDDLDK